MVLHACSSGSQAQGWCRQYKEGRGGREALLCVVGWSNVWVYWEGVLWGMMFYVYKQD